MRIRQALYLNKFFKDAFHEKYKLKSYKSNNEPAVFANISGQRTIKTVLQHKALGICIWCGGDAIKLMKDKMIQEEIRKRKNLKHITTSNFLSADLFIADIPYIEIPITEFKTEGIEPCEKGNKVYVYVSSKKEKKYNTKMIEYIRDNIPFEMEICNAFSYPRQETFDIYRDSFVGLRLTEHDGFSNMVAEMGLMGRKVISRLNSPNAIYWYNMQDVIDKISREYKNREYLETAEKMRHHLKYRDDFLYTEFWGQ